MLTVLFFVMFMFDVGLTVHIVLYTYDARRMINKLIIGLVLNLLVFIIALIHLKP